MLQENYASYVYLYNLCLRNVAQRGASLGLGILYLSNTNIIIYADRQLESEIGWI